MAQRDLQTGVIPLIRRVGAVTLLFALVVTAPPSAVGQWENSFETPETSWWLLPGDGEHQLKRSRRVFQDAIDGVGFEQLELTLRGKKPARVAHRVDPIRVIDELKIQLWVKSTRPGAQLAARVTLPHTADPETGQYATVLIRGDQLTEANRWTRLKLTDIATKLDRELPALRKSLGRRVDAAEAYLDLIVVEEAVGPGGVTIGVDGLVIDDIVFAADIPSRASVRPRSEPMPEASDLPPLKRKAPPEIRITAGVVEVDQQPLFVRAIEHSGEPLSFLRQLGFNAVKLRRPPTPQLDEEAARLGIWLIAPPTFDPQSAQKQQTLLSVIAWDLGDELGEAELEPARAYIAECRRSAPPALFLAGARSHRWEWSRMVDLLCLDGQGVLGSLELSELSTELQRQRSEARPGAVAYAAVHTEPPRMLVEQWRAYRPDEPVAVAISPEQMRQQAFQGVLSGSRGLIFRSSTRLDGKDSLAELRAASLRWLNLQLDLVAPWAATGDASRLSDAKGRTAIGALSVDRSTLLLLANQSPQGQFEAAPEFQAKTPLPVGSRFERTPKFQLTWRGIRQLGGAALRYGPKVDVERTGNVDFLIFSEDEASIRYATELVSQRRADFAASQLEVASLWRAHTQQKLLAPSVNADPLAAVDAVLQRSIQQLQRGDHYSSLQASEEALRRIGAMRVAAWKSMAAAFPSPLVSPLCVSADLRDAHAQLSSQLASRQWSENRATTGGLENIEGLQRAGWLAYQTPSRSYSTRILPSERPPQAGAASLTLNASSTGEDAATSDVTVAITSPGFSVRRGDLVRYQVWVRGVEGSPARVQVFDNLGGRTLAISPIVAPAVWTPLAFYRFAPADGEASLTVALLGGGEVDIDSIEIRTLSLREPTEVGLSETKSPK